jgi:hypothetical protein
MWGGWADGRQPGGSTLGGILCSVAPVKILRLGTSADSRSSALESERAPALLQKMLAEATGEEVEFFTRQAWPAPGLPDIVERWIREEEPDILTLYVNPFWYAFASAPLRLERTFGVTVGGKLSRIGRKTSQMPRLANSAPFKGARRVALKTVGGAYYFEVEEVLEVVTQCLRRILRHEEIVPVVRSPGRVNMDGGGPGWADERRRRMNAELRRLCGELHVLCRAPAESDSPVLSKTHADPDGRSNALGHAGSAEREFPMLMEAWRRLRGVDEPAGALA